MRGAKRRGNLIEVLEFLVSFFGGVGKRQDLTPYPDLFDKLNNNFTLIQSQIQEMIDSRNQLSNEQEIEVDRMKKIYGQSTLDLVDLYIPAVLSMKRELGLKFNENEYLKSLYEHRENAEKKISDLLG